MAQFVDLLVENPLLLLFLVAAIGYPLGQIKIAGASLGVAAVLFTGLAFGALDPDLRLPEEIYMLGLVLFVYTIGLASGSVFFASLNRRGLRYNGLVVGGLLFAALLTLLADNLFDFSASITAGMFSGSLTTTPGLAGVIEHIKAAGVGEPALSDPVVAYSLTYPTGVLGMILAVFLLQRVWKVNYADDARRLPDFGSAIEPVQNRTICITREPGITVAELVRRRQWNVVFGRLRRDGETVLVTGQTMFKPGDLVSLVGVEEEIDEVTRALGDTSCNEQLEFDTSQYDRRRIFVSSSQASGRRLRDLNIIDKFGALVTRIRRGDMEIIPQGGTVLMPGDQLRVVAPRGRFEGLARLFGDSYRAVSEVDILTFSLGMALGMLIGLVPVPLPGGLTIRLGLAGGPLITALIFGGLGRTGPLVWTIPLGANLTLRQVGLVFFLAGIGTRAGYAFADSLTQGSGLLVFGAGAAITTITALATLWVGYRLLRIPMGLLVGILSGLQTQPAVLSFGLEQAENELPNIGYAMVYPVAMILKILLAQALLVASQ